MNDYSGAGVELLASGGIRCRCQVICSRSGCGSQDGLPLFVHEQQELITSLRNDLKDKTTRSNVVRKISPTNTEKNAKKSKFEQLLDKVEVDKDQSMFTQCLPRMVEYGKKKDMHEEII